MALQATAHLDAAERLRAVEEGAVLQRLGALPARAGQTPTFASGPQNAKIAESSVLTVGSLSSFEHGQYLGVKSVFGQIQYLGTGFPV